MVQLDTISQPVVAASKDGRLELFTVAELGLYHIWQTDFSDHWSGWFSHGTAGEGLFSIPALKADANKQLQLFATTVSDDSGANSLFNLPQLAPNNGWGSWRDFGGPATGRFHQIDPPTLVQSADGRLELFVFTEEQDPQLYHIWQTNFGGDWTGAITHGHPSSSTLLPGSVAAASNRGGRLILFAVGNDGNLYHIEQTSVNSTGLNGWSDWLLHGHPPASPLGGSLALAPSADGRLELFAAGNDGNLYHIWQWWVDTNGLNGWSDWYSHGRPPAANVSVVAHSAFAMNADNRLELIVANSLNLSHIWQNARSGGWSDWQVLDTYPFAVPWDRPVLAQDPDQNLVLFLLARQPFPFTPPEFFYKKQTSTSGPNGGVWSNWVSLGHP